MLQIVALNYPDQLTKYANDLTQMINTKQELCFSLTKTYIHIYIYKRHFDTKF